MKGFMMNWQGANWHGSALRLFGGIGAICAFGLTSGALQAASRAEQILPEGTVSAKPEVRTLEVMHADEVAQLGIGGYAPTKKVPFRPTMDMADYEKAKAGLSAAAATAGPERRSERRAPGQAPTLAVQAPTLQGFNISGLNSTESGNLRPPDTHGASGGSYYCQIVNSRVACYNRTSPFSRVLDRSLAAFFGYFTETIFDPRIEYDQTYRRWVAYAEAFQEDPTTQFLFIAVSNAASPLLSWTVYRVDIDIFNNGDFWDYGQLGMTQDALVFTANIFNPGFVGARMFAVAKARLYNGLGFSVPVFSGLAGTLAPAKVLDQNRDMYLIAAPAYLSPGGTVIRKYTLRDAAYPSQTTLTGPVNIAVPQYHIPPSADQFGTATQKLDTLDARFVNRSTQIGNTLFNAHTVAWATNSSFAAPEVYSINTSTNVLNFSDRWYQRFDSDDFNVSVAVETTVGNPTRLGSPEDLYVTWTSTSPSAYNAQMVVSGIRAGGTFVEQPGVVCAGSNTFYNPSTATVERWGDYSAVDLTDTNDAVEATNEVIASQSVWDSQICRAGY